MALPARASTILERFGPLLALVLLIIGTAIVEYVRVEPDSRVFLTARNFNNLLGQWSFRGIVAVGMTFVIIVGGIDLSVGSIVALVAGLGVYAMNGAADSVGSGAAIAVACAVCILGGVAAGAVNGLVIAKGRIAPFVATLGTLAIFRSLILAPAEGSEIRAMVPEFQKIGSATLPVPMASASTLQLRVSTLIFLACAALAHVVLTRTVFGRQVYAIGDNATAARYAGIRIERVTIAVYAIAGLACGVSALLSASRLGTVSSSQLGMFYELDAIAAVVIGGTRLQGGAGRVSGTVVGIAIMAVVDNMLNMLGVSNFYHGLVKGLIILAAVLVQPRKAV